ncbi:hypothetical protein SAMN04488128_107105 [Chitinophaga eiseniae]|uniref:Uncharacterized protein n=1 Tax=Chitinophaga eiseniae TaxID=634771 RepID=A0A1T4TZU7_9BACT|nr:hypothetical protein SAMN04488128_107105 [Chitinophaga eiseniae]
MVNLGDHLPEKENKKGVSLMDTPFKTMYLIPRLCFLQLHSGLDHFADAIDHPDTDHG